MRIGISHLGPFYRTTRSWDRKVPFMVYVDGFKLARPTRWLSPEGGGLLCNARTINVMAQYYKGRATGEHPIAFPYLNP